MIHARRIVVVCLASLAFAGHAHAQWSVDGMKVYWTSGNVGVGTSNPAHKLDVRSSGTRAISAQATATNGRALYGKASATSGVNYGVFGQTNSPNGYAAYFLGGQNYFQGNVGIGTTNPQVSLDVAGDAFVQGPVFSQFGDVASLWIGDFSNRIYNTYGTGMQFAAYPNNSADMTIKSGTGNVGIGTDSPAEKLDVAGNIRCVALTQTSAREFKTDIAPLAGALDSIMRLRGVSYAWNDKAPESVKGRNDIGFLADEVNSVLPDIVAKDENGKPVGIDYGKITPVAVEAIKQLKNENDDLKARLEKLEAFVAAQAAKDVK